MNSLSLILGAVGAIVLTFGAAYVGSRFPVDEWYTALSKPSWNPPNWLFGPVWSVLYILMAISAWLVWREEGLLGAIVPLSIFILQLVLNAAWSSKYHSILETKTYQRDSLNPVPPMGYICFSPKLHPLAT